MKKRKNAEIRKPEILENYYQVIIEEGIEGASIGKIANRMGIHPSLIIHYFKTKKNLTLKLVDLMLEKYMAPGYLDFSHISNLEDRFNALIDTIFSESWSKTVDPGVHFCFYCLSFRNLDIQERFNKIFKKTGDCFVERNTGRLTAREQLIISLPVNPITSQNNKKTCLREPTAPTKKGHTIICSNN